MKHCKTKFLRSNNLNGISKIKNTDRVLIQSWASRQAVNSTFPTYQARHQALPCTGHILGLYASFPMPIEALRELEALARELVPFQQKSTAGSDSNPKALISPSHCSQMWEEVHVPRVCCAHQLPWPSLDPPS